MTEKSTSDLPSFANILVVLDPTRMVQPALLRGERAAKLTGGGLHLFCCFDNKEGIESQDAIIDEAKDWAERIANRTEEQGIPVSVQVAWDPDWRTAVCVEAANTDSDLVILATSRRRTLARRLMKPADWKLFRTCSCPTLLVNNGQPYANNRILAAVKLKPEDEIDTALNDAVVKTSHAIASALDSELHAVTVYSGEDVFFDRQRFANGVGLPRNRVHATEGSPHKGIAEISEDLDVDLIVIGSAAEEREESTIVGDTPQRLIGQVEADILILPAT